MMGPFSYVFFFVSKSWIQKKSCNPDRGTDGSLLPLRATCVPASCFGETPFLLPLAWLPQISEALSTRGYYCLSPDVQGLGD